MTSIQSTPQISSDNRERERSSPSKDQRLLFGISALLIVIGLVGWQIWTIQSTSADPKVKGQPLSNAQTHLHTLVLGGKAGVVYLGTHYGLFTSTDGGQSWPQARGVLDTLMITVISVNPADPSSLALVGMPSVGTTVPGGLYFSRDGGKSWRLHIPSNLPGAAYPYTVQGGSGGAEHFYAFYLYAGWFETRDMGQHWRRITSDSLSTMQNPVLLTFPGEPDHLLLGGDKGLFESRDDGQHWNYSATIHGTVQRLLVSQGHPAKIFCLTDEGIYTWEEGSTIPTHLPGAQAFSRLIIDPSGMMLYGLAGHILWSSQDGGKHWQVRQRFERGDLIAFQVDPHQANRLYAGFFQPPKVMSSQDSGNHWQLVTGQ